MTISQPKISVDLQRSSVSTIIERPANEEFGKVSGITYITPFLCSLIKLPHLVLSWLITVHKACIQSGDFFS